MRQLLLVLSLVATSGALAQSEDAWHYARGSGTGGCTLGAACFASSLTLSADLYLSTNSKLYMNGTTATHYLTYNGTSITTSDTLFTFGRSSGNAFQLTNFARGDFGSGSLDYVYSDGTFLQLANSLFQGTSMFAQAEIRAGDGYFTTPSGTGMQLRPAVANSGSNIGLKIFNLNTLSGSTKIVVIYSDASASVEVASVRHDGIAFGATGTPVQDSYAASSSIDFAGVTDACEDSGNITVTGAAVNDVCAVGPPATLPSTNSWVDCRVTATDTVVVRHCAHGASGNPAAATYTVRVIDP